MELKYHEQPGDAIRGKKIVVEAEKIEKPLAFSDRTARHGGRRTTARNGRAWIEHPYVRGPRL